MTDDAKLLRDYANHGSEAAFGELVARYIDLVYSTALRQVNGDTHLAQDVTQSVFVHLARRAGVLPTVTVLGGWLYRHTSFTAAKAIRTERRRQAREIQAVEMNALNEPSNTDAAWRQVAPVLDEAMQRLGTRDRDAIVLRYFERRDLRAVGAALGTNEDAAQKRVSRALEKLRTFLTRRGITFSATVLATTLASQAITAAPAGLAVSVTGAALAGAAAGGGFTLTLIKLMSMTKIKAAMVIVVAIATIIVLRWPNSSREKTSDAPQITPTGAQLENAKQDRFFAKRRASIENTDKTAEAAKVRLMFRVVDAETGEGLANTKIKAVYFYAGGRPEGYDLITDESGSAAILEPSEPNDQGLNVFVTAEGHVPKAVMVGVERMPEYTMKLDRALSVGGTVVDEQGQPVADVKISVQTPGIKEGQAEIIDFQTSSVTSDANGRWLCTYIPNDYAEIRFTLTREDYAATLPVVQVGKIDLTNLVLVINRGFAITGRITDPDGNPINGAQVKELHDSDYRRQLTKSGVDGSFILKGLVGESEHVQPRLAELNEDGTKRIRGMFGTGEVHADVVVQAKGFAPQRQTVHLVEPTNLVNFALAKGHILRGRVVDESGKPITKAVVRTDSDFRIRTAPRPAFEWRTSTDAEGGFEWDSAPAEEICFWFEADGYTVVRGLPLLADGSNHEIKLTRKTNAN